MDNERVVGVELERLAATDPLAPIDPQAMLTRGRRSRRNRRLAGAGTSIAAVAVVALGTTLLPNLNATGTDADTAGSTADFTAVPGIPRGEAGTGVELTPAEANRRCALRYPDIKRQLRPYDTFRAGQVRMYDLKPGVDAPSAYCIVPGGDKPSAALVEAARRDPVPTKQADQLRNCSVGFWTDLTKWRVLASDVDPGKSATLVAVSPSGNRYAGCSLWAKEPPRAETRMHLNSTIVRAPFKAETFRSTFNVDAGSHRRCQQGKCVEQHNRIGLVEPSVVRITAQRIGGGRHEVPVKNGWFALTWLDTKPSAKVGGLKFTAHHKDGHTEVIPR
ncbi:hypothetical protein HPO96_32250 [Kribbella sandramycini]|uniref:Uncharacterized protein n=1 Tax=Kribbella sandramycini TaxID=60450 RepID=A0A7Y4L5U6_9ACTN|nr:hypothetical protein [Kribbella sandramycini]MBB6565928.1 hypothetical protein [Kribbella sandramycini]NOL44934.1 hypothetical protein [Kribbella sandramycini]